MKTNRNTVGVYRKDAIKPATSQCRCTYLRRLGCIHPNTTISPRMTLGPELLLPHSCVRSGKDHYCDGDNIKEGTLPVQQ